MIIGIGIDLVEVAKIARSSRSETYIRKVFSDAEIEWCRSARNAGERFAGRFAAKEAFMKALGRGIRQGIWFRQIEVLDQDSGQPFICLSGEALREAHSRNVGRIHLSLSHTAGLAAAIVLLEQ